MTAPTSSLDIPRDDLQFTLHNGSDTTLSSDAYNFQFYAWHEDDWSLILKKTRSTALSPVEIPTGGDRRWKVRLNTADLASWRPSRPPNLTQTFVFRFPPGIYAFGYEVQPDNMNFGTSDTSTATTGGDIHLYTKQFDVTGDTFSLDTSHAFDKTVRHGDTLIIRTQTERENNSGRRVSLIADQLCSAPAGAAPLSIFELYNPGWELVRDYDRTFVGTRVAGLLRDGFACYNDSISRLRIETRDTTHPPLGLDSKESIDVVYEGLPWRLTSENGWSNQ